MAERKAVTRQMVARYQKGSKRAKGQMLDHLCALTGWNRDHARKALRQALGPPASRRSRTGAVTYGHEVLGPLRKIWAVLDAPAGKRLAPFLGGDGGHRKGRRTALGSGGPGQAPSGLRCHPSTGSSLPSAGDCR
jgi:hypothetical protein